MVQVLFPDLLGRAHEPAHDYLNGADVIVLRPTGVVRVDEDEAEVLSLFEVVVNCKACLEIGVQAVLYCLSLADLVPGAVKLLKEEALWVRLAERVQVLELAARYKQVDALFQAGSSHHHSVAWFLQKSPIFLWLKGKISWIKPP